MDKQFLVGLAACALLTASAAIAQPAISPPAIGMVRDSTGSLHGLIGIASNFVLTDTGISNAVSAAFSGSSGLIKTDTALLVLDACYQVIFQYDAPSGPALFAFDATGAPALAYYSGTLFRFNGQDLAPIWTGDAVAIALAAPRSASVTIRRDGQLWNTRVSLGTGGLESETLLAGVSGPVALLSDGGIVYTDQSDIVVRDRNGVERRVTAGIQVDYFEPIGKEWLAFRETGGGRLFAVRITQQGLSLSQVPEVTP